MRTRVGSTVLAHSEGGGPISSMSAEVSLEWGKVVLIEFRSQRTTYEIETDDLQGVIQLADDLLQAVATLADLPEELREHVAEGRRFANTLGESLS